MGVVYVLTNEAMPGIVKIGQSTSSALCRAKELYKGGSGVPVPFNVYSEHEFTNSVAAEMKVHSLLENHRVNKDREFFKMSPSEADIVINDLAEICRCPGGLDPDAARTFKSVTLGMNEYEYTMLKAACDSSERGMLDFIRRAVKDAWPQ